MENHCVDCCCARSWKALGVTEYDGRSIDEHITALRAENAAMGERVKDLELICKTWAQSDEDGNPWGIRITDGKIILCFGGDEPEFVLDADSRTGIPILTPEARAALSPARDGGKETT